MAKDFKECDNHFDSKYFLGIDVAVSTNQNSDETALTLLEKNGNQFYILECVHGKFTPEEWSNICLDFKKRYRNLFIVAEKNMGRRFDCKHTKTCWYKFKCKISYGNKKQNLAC